MCVNLVHGCGCGSFLLCKILKIFADNFGPLQMEKDDKGSTMIRMGVSG